MDEIEEIDEDLRTQIEEQLLSTKPIFVNGQTALHRAAERGLEEVVAQLLIACPSLIDEIINDGDDDEATALHFAARKGHAAIVAQLLLACPSLIDARDAHGRTALHCAAGRGNAEVVTQLLSLNSARANDESTAIDRARCSDGVVSQLLPVDDNGRTPLHKAAARGHEGTVAQLLAVCDPALIDEADNRGLTALHMAVAKGAEGTVAQLVSSRPTSVLAVSAGGWTVLHLAVYHRRRQLFSRLLAAVTQHANHELLLLQRTTDYHPAVTEGSTVLHVALRGDRGMVTQLLAACPALIDVVDEDLQTCAHCAAVHDGSIVETLLAFKPALAHALDCCDNTILHALLVSECVDRGLLERVREINPAAMQAVNRFGQTPFPYAVEDRNDEIIEWLQWSVTFDEVLSAYEGTRHMERFKSLVEEQCEELAVALIPDVTAIVFEYLGL